MTQQHEKEPGRVVDRPGPVALRDRRPVPGGSGSLIGLVASLIGVPLAFLALIGLMFGGGPADLAAALELILPYALGASLAIVLLWQYKEARPVLLAIPRVAGLVLELVTLGWFFGK